MDRGAWWATGHGVAKKVEHDLVTKQHQQQMNQFDLTGICGRLYPTTEEYTHTHTHIYMYIYI